MTPNDVPGRWRITLTGAKPGAGTYSGTDAAIYCSETFTPSGQPLWSVTAILLSQSITQLAMGNDTDGSASVSVTTPGGIETGLWFATGRLPGDTATVRGGWGFHGPTIQYFAIVSGEGSFSYAEGGVFTISVQVDCSTDQGGSGTD